jgi:fermentation-respiration switch protein FrsA (DUF1100 family)
MLVKTLQPAKTQKSISIKKPNFRRVRYVLNLFLFTCLVLYLTISVAGEEFFTKIYGREVGQPTPADYGLNYSEVSFPAAEDKLTIRGWFISGQSERVVLVLHGKGGNRTTLLPIVAPLAQSGFNLLLIDLRGHGASGGDNISYGYYEQRDVLGAVAYLKNRGFKPEHIGLFGHSMGAATGLLAMGKTQDIKAMVADSAYARLDKELEYAMPATSAGLLPSFLLPGMLVTASLRHGIDVNLVRPEDAVSKLGNQRLLLIQGDRDMLVPSSNIYRLKAAAGGKAEMWVVPGADHVQAYALHPDEYVNRLITFFKQEQ